jgi:hypothetical protein
MAEVASDQEAALRRLRAAFGFVEVLDHEQAGTSRSYRPSARRPL